MTWTLLLSCCYIKEFEFFFSISILNLKSRLFRNICSKFDKILQLVNGVGCSW